MNWEPFFRAELERVKEKQQHWDQLALRARQMRQGELRGLLLAMSADMQAIQHLEQTLSEIYDNIDHLNPKTGDQMGLALCLHHIYSAMESIFERINHTYDHIPSTANVRPAVISDALYQQLDDYRSFRHVVRHAYDYTLDWNKLERLVSKIPSVIHEFRGEMDVFVRYVQASIQAHDSEGM